MRRILLRKIEGHRYYFEIFSEDSVKNQEVEFYIRAICKSTKRTSCINNLNEILSLLFDDDVEHYLDDLRYVDSFWVVSKSEAEKFTKIALKYLPNPSFLNYLENKLDKDRDYGEWENIYEE